jgi:hypothetical protein
MTGNRNPAQTALPQAVTAVIAAPPLGGTA